MTENISIWDKTKNTSTGTTQDRKILPYGTTQGKRMLLFETIQDRKILFGAMQYRKILLSGTIQKQLCLGQYRMEKYFYLRQRRTEKYFYLGRYSRKQEKHLCLGPPRVSAITCSCTMDRYITSVVLKSSSSCPCTTTHNANHRHQPATPVLTIIDFACNYSWQQRKQQPHTYYYVTMYPSKRDL